MYVQSELITTVTLLSEIEQFEVLAIKVGRLKHSHITAAAYPGLLR